MKAVNIPFLLIAEANDNNYLRELSFYTFLKFSYVNSCIYNYSVNSLSKKTGLSRTSIKKYVSFCLSNGWAKRHGNNLVFIKTLQALQKNNLTGRFIKITLDNFCPKEILLKFKLQLLHNKERQVRFIIKKKRDILHPPSLKAYKSARRCFRGENVKSFNPDFQISIYNLATLWNCSIKTASTLLNQLKRNGELKVKKVRERMFAISRKLYFCIKDTLNYTSFWWHGHVYRVEANIIELKQYSSALMAVK